MPSVERIIETALYVADIKKSADFYRRIFGFATLSESERLIALDVAGRSLLLLFEAGATATPFATPGGVIPSHGATGPSHFAFAIAAEELSDWQQHLAAEGVAVESVVDWAKISEHSTAHSLYFRDPDAHLVELLTPGFWRIY
jgi:catechol 2,3-dioxygenase-like lactoylglutathione lyase family enzyme